jgi:putative hydrolase of the HAD superfamily
MSRIEAVISDFGGVLSSPLVHSFAYWQRRVGVPVEALGQALADVRAADGEHPLHELERGELTATEFLARVGSALTERVGRPVDMRDFAEVYFEHLAPNTEMIEHLRTLRESRGVRLALLTNNVREWEAHWRRLLPVDELFETVVDSGFVGMRKPEPGIYELTLERLGLPAQACVMLDDLEDNCEAARALGMAAVRFDSTEQAIRDLADVLG